MSMCYWMIFGIGFYMKDLMEHLDANKLLPKLEETQCVLSSEDKLLWKRIRNEKRLTLLLEYCETNFGFADILYKSDTLALLSYGNDGDDGSYLYYEPSFPWQMKENDCKSEADAREHLCDVVMPFLKKGTKRSNILALVNEINQVGAG